MDEARVPRCMGEVAAGDQCWCSVGADWWWYIGAGEERRGCDLGTETEQIGHAR